jgi:hypothetical protein
VLVHAESTRLQYGLVSRAEAYGWSSDRIVVIDDDLGKSGTTTVGRVGFERLVTEVSLGHVGLILGHVGLILGHVGLILGLPDVAFGPLQCRLAPAAGGLCPLWDAHR